MARTKPGERVLDVGCGTGAIAQRLSEKGCKVTGIEIVTERAREAEAYCDRVLVGDVLTMKLDLEPESYDVILFSNVLEHLVDPARALQRLVPLLREGGRFIVDLPNVANWGIRQRLLRGHWDYTDGGIMDRTHLRFYTWKTAREMLRGAGFTIIEEDVIPDVPVLRRIRRFPALHYKVAKLFSGLASVEMLFVARPEHQSPVP